MTVSETLFSEPWEFEFFEAVRLLEFQYPQRSPSGEQADPEREAVRLKSLISFVFAASEIQALKKPESDGSPATMTVNLFGVGGVDGPLPQADADRVIEQSYLKNPAFGEFLDIFHHRILSLLVRMQKVHRPSYTTASPDRGPGRSLSIRAFRDGDARDAEPHAHTATVTVAVLGLAGAKPALFSGSRMSAVGLFPDSARVSPPIGRWMGLESASRHGSVRGAKTRIGRRRHAGYAGLERAGPDRDRVGSDELLAVLDLLRGSGYNPLCELTRFYAGPDPELSFRLSLLASDVPASRLGSPRLGWTSWIRTSPFESNDSQVKLCARRPADPFAQFHTDSLPSF